MSTNVINNTRSITANFKSTMKKIFLCLLAISCLISCKEEPVKLSKITAQQIPISDSIEAKPEITQFIAPYKERIDRQMDSVLAYSPRSISKTDGAFNTAIGNMMADAVWELSNPIFKSRTNKTIDAVILNHGGIRSALGKGDVTMRDAYAIMPFDNSVVVVELTGKKVNELFTYLKWGKAHPIAGMQLVLDKNKEIKIATIGGKPVDTTKTYFIATNDYLQQGGDKMTFLSEPVSMLALDYKIRNLLIDYFSKHDTIAPVRDQRFIMQ